MKYIIAYMIRAYYIQIENIVRFYSERETEDITCDAGKCILLVLPKPCTMIILYFTLSLGTPLSM